MRDFLNYQNRELARLEVGPTVVEGTSPWQEAVEYVRIDRLAWAKTIHQMTGIAVVGTSDGHWVRKVNRELLDRLATRLGLDATSKSALIQGDNPGSVPIEEIRRAGTMAAAEVEAEYKKELSEHGISGWLRKYGGSTTPIGGKGKKVRTVRIHVRDEFSLFWSWVEDLRKVLGGRPSGAGDGESFSGFMMEVVSLLGEEPRTVQVLSARQLSQAPAQVVQALHRVVGYLAMVDQPEGTETELLRTGKFFERMGLCLENGKLKGYLAKNWTKALSSELFSGETEPIKPEQYQRAQTIFVSGMRRLFEASGLSFNQDSQLSADGLRLQTGIVERATHLALIHAKLDEVVTSGIDASFVKLSRLDGMWSKRKAGTVYGNVIRPLMGNEARRFWDDEIARTGPKDHERNVVLKETLGDVRLASLVDGASAGWLRWYLQNKATVELRLVLGEGAKLDPAARRNLLRMAGEMQAGLELILDFEKEKELAGPLTEEHKRWAEAINREPFILEGEINTLALAPFEIWKELRAAIFWAKIWGYRELFYRGDVWMGLSSGYVGRLRAALKRISIWMENRLDHQRDLEKYWSLVRNGLLVRDAFFDGQTVRQMGDTLYEPKTATDKGGYQRLLMDVGINPMNEDEFLLVRKNKSGGQKKCYDLTVDTVVRLLLSGFNRAQRTLNIALMTGKRGLPEIWRPMLAMDGPLPTAYLQSLRASRWRSFGDLYTVRANREDFFNSMRELTPELFKLDALRPALLDMQSKVTIEALCQQWSWVKEHPQLVPLGGTNRVAEIKLILLGLEQVQAGKCPWVSPLKAR